MESARVSVRTGAEFNTSRGVEDHEDRLRRTRRVAIIAVAAWTLFAVIDWYIVAFLAPGRLWFYLSLRGIGMVTLLGFTFVVFASKEPSSLLLRVSDTTVSVVLSALITVSCLEFGGIESPLAMGVMLILLCRSFAFLDHWKRSIVPFGLVVISYPLTLLGMALVWDRIAVQFGDSRAVAAFFLNLMFVTGAGGMAVAGGHMVWTLKRQLYNSRALGRYKLKKRIGAGGMGEIWLAHHHALRRDVAVKILRPENASDERAIARFEREVRATSELAHPNTIRVFDYGVTRDGIWYYAMELLKGRDLHEEIRTQGVMDPKRAARLVGQAARALHEAHSRGIIHRDIKPENLFLTSLEGEGEFVKVLDFGLAKLTEKREDSDKSLTQAGWAVGTPLWVSPEVVMGGHADGRSDMYGLGAVLYYLLCACTPFHAKDIMGVMQGHASQEIKRPSERVGAPIHKELEDIALRAMAKNPSDRFADIGEMAIALEDCGFGDGAEKTEEDKGLNTNALRAMERTFSPVLPKEASGDTLENSIETSIETAVLPAV